MLCRYLAWPSTAARFDGSDHCSALLLVTVPKLRAHFPGLCLLAPYNGWYASPRPRQETNEQAWPQDHEVI